MPDLEPRRPTSAREGGPRPCVFEPPAWNWTKSNDTGWWVRADWASALLHDGRLRRDLARVLADLTARLHDAGFVHQDFHPGNLLLRIEPGDRLRLAVIDLDALRVTRRVSWDGVRENLALLNHYFWSRCNRADR